MKKEEVADDVAFEVTKTKGKRKREDVDIESESKITTADPELMKEAQISVSCPDKSNTICAGYTYTSPHGHVITDLPSPPPSPPTVDSAFNDAAVGQSKSNSVRRSIPERIPWRDIPKMIEKWKMEIEQKAKEARAKAKENKPVME